MIVCAITGHRRLGRDFSEKDAEIRLMQLVGMGVDVFLCGMAMGFDMLCCEILLRLREKYPIKIVAVIPCKNQSEKFPESEKRRYENLKLACDRQEILHEKYVEGCMFERNRKMVDECDLVFAYLKEARGGTKYTVDYAKKKGKPIVFL